MEPTKKRTHLISAIVALLVILVIAGAYVFDHRFDDEVDSSTQATSSSQASEFIQLENYSATTTSDTSNWTTYTNTTHKFSLKYPSDATVRKFVDGKDIDYGIGITLKEAAGDRFTEKYFELTTDTSKGTVCDALIQNQATSKSSLIGGLQFIKREYRDESSLIREYVGKANNACYRGYLSLKGSKSAISKTAENTEFKILEDIMSTFKLSK